MAGRPEGDHPLRPRLAGALVALTAFEALLFESWPALAAAAVLAAVDLLGRRSPYEALAAIVAPAPPVGTPSPPARLAALQRATLLAVAAGLLAAGQTGAAWAAGAVAIAEAAFAALSGRPLLGAPGRPRRRA